MEEKSIEEIIKLAELYRKDNIPWHHHFLPPGCVLNKSDRFQIILENEKSRESFFTLFDYKPMKELELLENVFFGRVEEKKF